MPVKDTVSARTLRRSHFRPEGSGISGEDIEAVLEGGGRLDKALAAAVDLSRSRLRALIEAGAVTLAGAAVTDPSAAARPGTYRIALPAPVPAEAQPEPIPLSVLHEDPHLIVVDKPAGMVVHPAPGAPSGTLVNALLFHCGEGLRGIGGVERPGIVHRIDKDTSGALVVAKTEAAHRGLAALFAAHDVDRRYDAVCWGVPSAAEPRLAGHPAVTFEGAVLRIDAPIARHPTDRLRMAVRPGRHAVTRAAPVAAYGVAARLECRLETGRTHQIRVHLSHLGHPLVGDPVYGRRRAPKDHPAAAALDGFARQALHAATLGFRHPVTGTALHVEAPMPADLAALLAALAG